jgi:hypothetical protein
MPAPKFSDDTPSAPTPTGKPAGQPYWMCTPLMARLMISRWISEVPSKIV